MGVEYSGNKRMILPLIRLFYFVFAYNIFYHQTCNQKARMLIFFYGNDYYRDSIFSYFKRIFLLSSIFGTNVFGNELII